MAIDYTPTSTACGNAAGIWTLTEVAQRLSRSLAWPKSLITALGPTENTDETTIPVASPNPVDILLKCREATVVYTGSDMQCGGPPDAYDYASGTQWEVSKDYGASWQPLENRYNLNSQRISIGQFTRASDAGDYMPLSAEPKVDDGLYQFYGYIDSVRISGGVPRYTESVVTPYDPNNPNIIDANTLFAINLGAYRAGANKVGSGDIGIYAAPRPFAATKDPLPHAAELSPPFFRVSLSQVPAVISGVNTTIVKITTIDDDGNEVPHGLLPRAPLDIAEFIVFEAADNKFPSSIKKGQTYEVVDNEYFTPTTFCVRNPQDAINPLVTAIKPWNFCNSCTPEYTATNYPALVIQRAPVYAAVIMDNQISGDLPPFSGSGALAYSNLENGMKRRVDMTVSNTTARDAIDVGALFVGMCVQTTAGSEKFWALETLQTSPPTWVEVVGYSPAIQFLTRESHYTSAETSNSNYLIFNDTSRYGWEHGQFNISPNQQDFCAELYFKVLSFRHSYNYKYPAATFQSVILNTQSWEETSSGKISGDGIRIYVKPNTQQTYTGADNDGSMFKTVYEDDIGDLFVDVGFSKRVLRFSGLHSGRFYHVAVTRQLDTFRLYIDGIKIDEIVLQPVRYAADTLAIAKNHYRYRATWTRGALRTGTSKSIRIQVTQSKFFFTNPATGAYPREHQTVYDDAGEIRWGVTPFVLNRGNPIKPANWATSATPEHDPHVYIIDDAPVNGVASVRSVSLTAVPYITFSNPLPNPLTENDIDEDAAFPGWWELSNTRAVGTGLDLPYSGHAGTLIPPVWADTGSWTALNPANAEPQLFTSGTELKDDYEFSTTSDKLVFRARTRCSESNGYGRNIVIRMRSWLQPLVASFGITPTETGRSIDATLRHRVRVATTGNTPLVDTGTNALVIDGVTLQDGDLILVKDPVPTTGVALYQQCGVYVYSKATWVTTWARANLLSLNQHFTLAAAGLSTPQFRTGTRIEVLAGTTNGGKVFRLASDAYTREGTNENPAITLGTTQLFFRDEGYTNTAAGITAESSVPTYTTAVHKVTLKFSKPLQGGKLAAAITNGKLTLQYTNSSQVTTTTTLNNANLLTTISGSGDTLFLLENLASYNSAAGRYTLKLEYSNSDIKDQSENPLSMSPQITWIIA